MKGKFPPISITKRLIDMGAGELVLLNPNKTIMKSEIVYLRKIKGVLLCGTLCRGIVVVRYAVPWYYMLYRWYHLCGSKVASTSSPWFHSSRGVYIEPLIP